MRKNDRKITIMVIVFILFCITLGYAYLNSQLSITGGTTIAGNNWDIHFTNLVVQDGSVSATNPAAIDISDNTKVTYSVRLEKPGDFYEFKVDIKNFGSLPGKVSEVNVTGINESYSSFLDCFVGYSKFREVRVNDLLNPDDYKTITVRVAYKDDITSSDLPNSMINLNLSFQVTYVQSDKYEPVMLSYNGLRSSTNYFDYNNSIDSIIFNNSLYNFSNAVEVWDFGVFPNTIKASLVPVYNDDTKYILYIFGDGNILAPRDSSQLFSYLNNITGIYGLNYLDTYNVTNMQEMFKNTGHNSSTCHIDLGNNFDTSNVTNMKEMFFWAGYTATGFTLNLGEKFDTSNVTNMNNIFWKTGYNSQVFTLDLGDYFDTKNVTDMERMFYDAGFYSPIFTLDLGDKFDTSNVTIMKQMFFDSGYSSTVYTLDLGDKFNTKNVVDMTQLFYFTGRSNTSFTLDLGDKFKLDSAVNMRSVFCFVGYNNPNFELDLSSVVFKTTGNFDYFFSGFQSTQKIYVKNAETRDWIINNFGDDNQFSISNVLIKS